MKKINKNIKWIRNYSRAVKLFTFDHDPSSHLPFNAFNFYPMYFDLWLDKIYEAIFKIKSRRVSQKIIKINMPSYGALRFIVYTLINMANYYDYNHNKIKAILNFFIEMMDDLSKDADIFNEHMIKLKNDDEIKKILKNIENADCLNDREVFSRLTGVLALYNHALYNDYSTEYGYALEGPYEIDGKVLIIRNYPDLSPVDLWPELEDFDIKEIKILSVYGKIKIKMRFISTHLICAQKYQNKLNKYLIYVNGEKLDDLVKINQMTKKIADLTFKIYKKQKSFNLEETKKLFLKQQGYEIRGLFDLAGIDWRPDKNIIKRIRNKKIADGIISKNYPETKKEYEDYIGTTYLKEVYEKN